MNTGLISVEPPVAARPGTAGKPFRVQLSRAQGWRMPENTVKVDRTTKWGNPYRVGDRLYDTGKAVRTIKSAAEAVQLFRERCLTVEVLHLAKAELSGKNLGCWCTPGNPCHADVLLEIANMKGQE
jgi:hypothetical protein